MNRCKARGLLLNASKSRHRQDLEDYEATMPNLQ